MIAVAWCDHFSQNAQVHKMQFYSYVLISGSIKNTSLAITVHPCLDFSFWVSTPDESYKRPSGYT